ncbi:MAG: hypothetical protein A2W03_00105 [Candidatus Aminicenantes bacterium RBG_16_63_16]|nr:MAG: hypothetical protein A2W03_00105 [Candidatus Aminicenantes bacterium RBG_16_63_16]
MRKRKMHNAVTRRDFIKGAALGTLAIALSGRERDLVAGTGAEPAVRPFAAQNPQSVVVLVRSEKAVGVDDKIDAAAVQDLIDTAVKELAGEADIVKAWAKFVRPEDTVGVKFTRCSWMRVHTEQPVIDAIVKRVGEAGVAGGKIIAQDEGLPVAKCTALINVPTVKVHTLTGIAVALKNYINFSSKPSSYHAPSTNLGEIYLKPEVKGKTRLIIVDVLRPYFGPGPQINPLHRWNYGGIMVGTDPVAIDTTCLKLCQVKRRLFKGEDWPISPPADNITAADKTFNLGTSDPAKIKLVKLGWDKDVLI